MAGLLLLILVALVTLRYAGGGRYRPMVDRALGTGITLGLIGFGLGFFGPMMLAPGANQGPMLGIFITVPLGVAGGLACCCSAVAA